MNKRFAILASTGGSVFKTVFSNTSREDFNIDLVITDRICGASEFAIQQKIPLVQIEAQESQHLSEQILAALQRHKIDYVYVFYTRLLKEPLTSAYTCRLINFHPSILPACPGLNGFEDTVASGAILAGSTVHFIDNGVDTGEQLLQAFTATLNLSSGELRHRIFAQQCAALYQIHKWITSEQLRSQEVNRLDSLQQGFIPNISISAYDIYKKILSGKN